MQEFLESLLPWFIQYKYALVFPIAVIEGPVVTVFTGFLASLGYMNFFLAYLVVVIADLVGDAIYYSVGRFGRKRFVEKHGHHIGITQERLEKAERHFNTHARKTLIAAKFVHGLSTVTWIAAGVTKVNFAVFMEANAVSTAVKSLILISLGYFFGKTYLSLSPSVQYAPLILIVAYLVVYIVVTRIKFFSNIWNRLQ